MRSDGGLRAKLHKHVPGHWTAIESGYTAPGVPDSEGCLAGGVTVWVESKVRRSRNGVVKFQPGQIPWLGRRTRAGGRCFVLVQGTDDVCLYFGKDAPALSLGQAVTPIGQWPKSRVDWDELAYYLIRPLT